MTEKGRNDEERMTNDGGNRGNVATERERIIRELANWKISKLVSVVGEKWRGSGEVLRKRGAGGLNFGKVCDAKVTFQRVVRL